ncbi:Glycosyl transferase group 1 OS=Sphaerobacter thermophilus (strain DSM 20745 / S 6022) GN=Sthe_0904 PE=4 SV=1: Glyco_trans_4_4: Glycos_transf_1 [Gemmata massiliana]|uniref:Glycosyl transferase family 1 domain-containing protein n=1 Tax=Gemmata massiliana TaxID=1210884 RepID=A0A6P2CVX2_9BACT|nr:glycosyltransferase family 1 protein [Gemmata massiliana]VTR93089.1 Glycosyl transferase group 1 OS=Sphaerobacter thermophilus (strain DSM 20745 / S 6022) GN=Sthe_0904 PE=4 SV=1: Glyco_trans_4_4: Glycos_transf_1 [Gemmata massiliana]
MRIGLNALMIAPGLAGDRVYCEELIRALTAAPGDDEFVVFVRCATTLPSCQSDRVRLVQTPVPQRSTIRRTVWEYGFLPRAVRRAGLDLIHGLGGRSPAVRGVPFVLSIADLIYRQFPQSVPLAPRLFMRLVQPYMAQRADRVIVPSASTARQVVELLGVHTDRIRLIPYGPGHTFGPVPNEGVVERVITAHNVRHPYILSVCRGYPHKNLTGLLRAFARLPALGHSTTQLVLVGDPHWSGPEISRLVNELGIADRVACTGFLELDELRALLTGATLFAFPSLAEGFGLPVLEAMACGTPVVGSNASAVCEVVGGAGVLARADDPVEFAEALARTLGDDKLRDQLRVKGRARAREFSWERCAAATLAVYHELS